LEYYSSSFCHRLLLLIFEILRLTMLKQSPSRIQRTKSFKVKQGFKIFTLVVVGIWLIYQLKQSHDTKKDAHEVGKFGRKVLNPYELIDDDAEDRKPKRWEKEDDITVHRHRDRVEEEEPEEVEDLIDQEDKDKEEENEEEEDKEKEEENEDEDEIMEKQTEDQGQSEAEKRHG
ncbi:hypothetical protein PIB30_056530, partial [Stylosanthes scabra]|nr:hypothetical protein [Stylosanthes scabra]